MKLFDLLKEDHREIQALFDMLKGQQEKSWETVRGLCERLELHLTLEEQYLYPVLEKHGETADLIQKSIAQHNETKRLIKLITGENLDDEALHEKLEMLRVASGNHFQKENDELFSSAQRVLSEEEMQEIGSKIETRKKQVLNL